MSRSDDHAALLRGLDLHVSRGGAPVIDIEEIGVLPGEALVLIGPNGAGKSTLLLTLAGLLKPTRGSLYFHGSAVGRGGFDYRRHIAMVFQEPLLFDTTVFENVAVGLKIRGMKKEEIARTVPGYLDRFGIAHLAHRSARKLSGGEAQRTSLARAFVTRPEIVFLDEPFSALDLPTREALTGDLERILHETRTTAIASTHDQTEALRLADRLAMMSGGRIIQIGAPDDVFRHPVNARVASFVGMENMLTGRIIRISGDIAAVAVAGGEIDAAVNAAESGDAALCCIRPEDVTLFPRSHPFAAGVRNVFPGRIASISPLGPFYRVRVQCGFELAAYLTRQSLETGAFAEGLVVYASFSAESVHIIRQHTP
jgi:tungstate transport system ATP-binding protein